MAGKADEAIAEAEKALKTEPDNVSVYLTLGRAYGGKRDYEKAAAALEHAERLQPSIETLYSLAISWLSLGNAHGNAQAEAAFERMRKMAGESGSLHVLIGRAYRDAGMMPQAASGRGARESCRDGRATSSCRASRRALRNRSCLPGSSRRVRRLPRDRRPPLRLP